MSEPEGKRPSTHSAPLFPAASLSRRTLLKWAGLGLTGSALLAACAPTGAPAAATPEAGGAAAEAGPAASAEDGMMRPGGTPKRGGTLRAAFGVTTSNYDIHQGGSGS